MHEVYNVVNQINDVHWNETVIFCGHISTDLLILFKQICLFRLSQRASWLVGLKMVSKRRALICLYSTRVSQQVNSYPDQYIIGRVPGYLGIFPRPSKYIGGNTPHAPMWHRHSLEGSGHHWNKFFEVSCIKYWDMQAPKIQAWKILNCPGLWVISPTRID